LESFAIRALGEGAKLLGLVAAVAVFLALPGLYGLTYRRVQRWLGRRSFVMAFYALTSAVILLLAILPLLDGGFLGSNTLGGSRSRASWRPLRRTTILNCSLDPIRRIPTMPTRSSRSNA